MNLPPRVDAHQHFWLLADRQGHWPPATLEAIYRDFAAADFEPLRECAGIDGTVLVQSLPSEADTRYLLQLADRHPFIWGVVGWLDMCHALFESISPALPDAQRAALFGGTAMRLYDLTSPPPCAIA